MSNLPRFSSRSGKARDPTKKSRSTKTTNPTSGTAPPKRYADDFDLPTRPEHPPKPAQMPLITTRQSLSAINPGGGGEMSSSTYATSPPKSDTPEAVPEVGIIIMGATGSGKSTFINLVSGSSLDVSEGLGSCTNRVQVAQPFDLDGRRVVLIDTPGFDDTTQSDTDVLRMIAAFLEAWYEQGLMLAGVLYFHRISDLRMGGTQTRNLRMFRHLCGDDALKNVVIVTNMWSAVEPEVGDAREAELMEEDTFFKPVLDRGAQMARHKKTIPSAEAIIRLLVNNHPLPLQIQRELIDERRDIVDTSAGRELNQELNGQIKKHQEDVRVLAEEMEQATREKDEETRNELEIETRRMHEEIQRVEDETRRLASDYRREKREFQARLMEIERARREGYRGVGYSQYTSRSGGNHSWSSRSTSYRPTPAITPTTEGQWENSSGRFGRLFSSRDSRDKPSRTSAARAYIQNLYDNGGFGSRSSRSPYD